MGQVIFELGYESANIHVWCKSSGNDMSLEGKSGYQREVIPCY